MEVGYNVNYFIYYTKVYIVEMYKPRLLKKISDAMLPTEYSERLRSIVFSKFGPADINGWTIVHFMNGVLLSICSHVFTNIDNAESSLLLAVCVHTVWEIFQFTVGDNKFDLESLFDISADTTAFLSGWFIVYLFSKRKRK
jgi:hypothetical protein